MKDNTLKKNGFLGLGQLGKRLLIYILMFSTLVTIIASAIQLQSDYQQDISELNNEISLIETVHLKPLTESVWLYNDRMIITQLEALRGLPGISQLEIVLGGKVYWQIGLVPEGTPIITTFPMLQTAFGEKHLVGKLRVIAGLDEVYRRLVDRVWLIFITNAVKIFLIAGFTLFIIHFIVIRHLKALAEFVRHTDIHNLEDQFQYDRKIRPGAKPDELDELIGSFNAMRQNVSVSIAEKVEAEKIADRALSANQAKSEFLANMSHEIRTPMNAILGFTEILAEMENDDRVARYLRHISTSGNALLNLINDVLDLSKIESGKLELQYSAVSIPILFRELVTILGQKINDKGLLFIVDPQKTIPEALVLDETRVRQLLINLIGNAIKFTHQGEIRLTARVKMTDEESRSRVALTIEVADTGIGIPKIQQQKIFEAFEQLPGQKVARFGGTGLGLAITRRLVEMMEGQISVESEEDKGTCFRVTLPAVEVAAIDAFAGSLEKNVNFDAVTFDPATILITDDIDYNREILTLFLTPFKFNLIYARNGQEALDQSEEHHPDLILMDMKMPVMDGYKATEILRKDNVLKRIPVIAVTASALLQDENRIAKLTNGYLRKPVSKSDLIAELMKHLIFTQ